MKHLYITSIICTCAVLAGCGSSKMVQPNQEGRIKADKGSYTVVPTAKQQAQDERVVTHYIPVAVPGQLMPLPNAGSAAQTSGNAGKTTGVGTTPVEVVEQAEKQAIVEPQASDFFNAMATYSYMPGAMYTIYSAPMKITDIQFAPGEEIVSYAAGDTLRWNIAKTYSGSGTGKIEHLLVKPQNADTENTLIITTNLHTYHLILISTNNGAFMIGVKWQYPTDMVQMSGDMGMPSVGDNSSSVLSSRASSAYEVNLGELNFDYRFGVIKGSRPQWMPVRVFNDGRQTFIEFPPNFSQDALPILLSSDNNGAYGTTLNWRMKGRYMVVDSVLHDARLESGIDKQGKTVVQIEKIHQD